MNHEVHEWHKPNPQADFNNLNAESVSSSQSAMSPDAFGFNTNKRKVITGSLLFIFKGFLVKTYLGINEPAFEREGIAHAEKEKHGSWSCFVHFWMAPEGGFFLKQVRWQRESGIKRRSGGRRDLPSQHIGYNLKMS